MQQSELRTALTGNRQPKDGLALHAAPAIAYSRNSHMTATGSAAWFRRLSILYLILGVLGPWISTGTVRGIRPEELLLPVMVVVCLVGNGLRWRITVPMRYILTGLAIVAASISCSLLASMTRAGEGPVMRDMSELLRVAKYALIVVLAGQDAGTSDAARRSYVALVVVSASLGAVQALAPSATVFRVMSSLDPGSAHFYASQNAAAGLLRVTGMFGNPNNFGVFLATGAGLLIGLFLRARSTRGRILIGSGLIGVSGVVLLTQSFTGIVALGIVFAAGFAIMVARREYRRQAVVLVLVTGALVSGFLIQRTSHSDTFVVGERLMSTSYAVDTMAGRFRVWARVMGNVAEDPSAVILGMGPHKESEEKMSGGDIDSEYVMILKRYGAVGSVAFLALVVLVIVAIHAAIEMQVSLMNGWGLGAYLMLLAILVCGVTNVVYVNNQLMDVFLFLLGSIAVGNDAAVQRSSKATV